MAETKADLEAYILNVILEHQNSSPNDLAGAIADMLNKCPGAPSYPEGSVENVCDILERDDRVTTEYPKSVAMTILSNLMPSIKPVDLAGWGDIDA